MSNEFTREESQNQVQFLSDKNSRGKERPWRDKKVKNGLVKDCYLGLANEDVEDSRFLHRPSSVYWGKAERMNLCSSYLEFKVEEGRKKLSKGYFCQMPLCPVCSWRKEMKVRVQLGNVVAELVSDYRFIFLTLTCQNVHDTDLPFTIDLLYEAFHRMFKLRPVKRAVEGYFRALEITHDTQRKITKKMYNDPKRRGYYDSLGLRPAYPNPNFNKYHPHFHVMIAVKPEYFDHKKGLYISQEQWTDYWQQSLRVNYRPIVDVRAVKGAKDKGILEVAKYTVKDADYIVKQDKLLTTEVVATLDNALHRRRIIGYAGEMKKAHKRLNLDENITADIHLDEDGEEYNAVKHIVEYYRWNSGYKNYVLSR